MKITITEKGSFSKTETTLRRLKDLNLSVLDKYGEMGVVALSNATPMKTGQTAASWYYEIESRPGYYSIHWCNRNREYGKPVAILIEYGHGTRNGGYVQGRNFIMPAIRPIFDQMAADAWKEVTK